MDKKIPKKDVQFVFDNINKEKKGGASIKGLVLGLIVAVLVVGLTIAIVVTYNTELVVMPSENFAPVTDGITNPSSSEFNADFYDAKAIGIFVAINFYDDEYLKTNQGGYNGFCDYLDKKGDFQEIENITCNETSSSYALSAPLLNEDKYFCIDSEDTKGKIKSDLGQSTKCDI